MRRRFTLLIGRIIALGAALTALPAFAHEKWFVDEALHYSSRPVVFSELTVFGVIVVGLAFIVFSVLYLLDRKYEKFARLRKFDKTLSGMRHDTKTVLAALLGASLMGAGLQHTFLVPNLVLPETTIGIIFAAISILLGIAFVFFVRFTPELGIALAALYLLGFTLFPVMDILEELLILALAIYFVTEEMRRLPWKKWNTEERRRKGYHAFRILLGLSFVILSFVKWSRPDLAISLVNQYDINFIKGLGFNSAHFVFFAAVTELFIGLAIIFRIFLRPIALLGLVIFSVSIFVFGSHELVGHLPIQGALFLLFIYGPYLERKTV